MWVGELWSWSWALGSAWTGTCWIGFIERQVRKNYLGIKWVGLQGTMDLLHLHWIGHDLVGMWDFSHIAQPLSGINWVVNAALCSLKWPWLCYAAWKVILVQIASDNDGLKMQKSQRRGPHWAAQNLSWTDLNMAFSSVISRDVCSNILTRFKSITSLWEHIQRSG